MERIGAATVAAWAAHMGVTPESVDPASLRAELADGTLPAVFAESARRRPGSFVAVDGDRRALVQVLDQAARVASVLRERDLEPGRRVLVSSPTSWDLVLGYLAALHAGTTVVLANPAYTDDELHALVERAGAAAVLSHVPRPDLHIGASTIPALPLHDLVAQGSRENPAEPARVGRDDAALLAFTSGTTGSPKGVPLTHGMLLSSVRAAMLAWRWSPDDVLVHALPLFHQHGLSGLHASLIAGSSVSVLSSFDPHALVAAVGQEAATVVFGVPSIHQRLSALGAQELLPLRGLRLLTSGSAPLTPETARAVAERTGLVPLERYGLTESGLDVSNLYDAERVPGTVGVPLPGVEVGLRAQSGDAVDDAGSHDGDEGGEGGEIVLRGPQVFAGYLDDPDATDKAFWPGGWFRTGDLGRWDEDGRLVITGRLKELIITGGMNVTPREVEQVIERHPAIAEAAVAGVPSERWGEEVTAWVVPGPATEQDDGCATVDEDDVIALCRRHLAAYKCPKRVLVVARLPRNSMGKLVRSDLPATVPERG